MKQNLKKSILNLILLAAIALFIVSLFSPIVCFDQSDVLEESGYEDYQWYWMRENSIVLSKLTVYDFRDTMSEEGHAFYRYLLLTNFVLYEIGESEAETITEYDREEPAFISTTMADFFAIICFPIAFILIIYLLYNGFKYFFIRKNNFFMYLGLLLVVGYIIFFFGQYYFFDFVDTEDLGYTNVLNFGYGFYTSIACIVLFFIIHFIQRYFLDFSKENVIKEIK